MSKRTYFPDRGDIIAVNFMPQAGREIDKRRPAIVLTPQAYNKVTGFCVVAPITSDLSPSELWVPVPDGLLEQPSLVLSDYFRSVDFRERSAAFICKAPSDLIDSVVGKLLDLLDPRYE